MCSDCRHSIVLGSSAQAWNTCYEVCLKSYYASPHHRSSWQAPTDAKVKRLLRVDGLKVLYERATDEQEKQSASVIANRGVPLQCPLFYYEVLILNKGGSTAIGRGGGVTARGACPAAF